MNDLAPSMAATLLPERDPASSIPLMDRAMRQARYVRYDALLPAHYRPHQGEWVGVLLRPVPAGRGIEGTLVIPNNVGLSFKVATWLSAADPDAILVSWRAFQGFEGVTKYLFSGKPQWKHGTDKDMEVGWHVPAERPVTLRMPEQYAENLPFEAADADALFRGSVRPFPKDAQREPNERLLSYVLRSSPLA